MVEADKAELPVIHPHHTACSHCVFALHDGVTQTGCSLGRLDKFREQGTEVVEAVDGLGNEFFVVNGRLCLAHRDRSSEWAKQVPGANRAAAVRAELTQRVDVVVPVSDDVDVGRLPATIESLRALALKPSSVHVINNGAKAGDVVRVLRAAAGGLDWQVSDIRERKQDDSKVDVWRAIDIIESKLKGHFYTLLYPGAVLPPSFTADLDRAVVDDMARFVVLRATAGEVGFTVSLGFHRAPMVQGNKAIAAELLDQEGEADAPTTVLLKTVLEKAQYIAGKHGLPHLVANTEDVCPSLK
jgi:hypothetical protein